MHCEGCPRPVRLRDMNQSPPTHGHEVLRLLATYADGCDIATLHSIVAERFGAKPVFVNCKDTRFDLTALLDFFVARGKITMIDKLVRLTGAEPCDNERRDD